MIITSLSRASQLNVIVADVVVETLKLFGGSGGGNAVDNKRFYMHCYAVENYEYQVALRTIKIWLISVVSMFHSYKILISRHTVVCRAAQEAGA